MYSLLTIVNRFSELSVMKRNRERLRRVSLLWIDTMCSTACEMDYMSILSAVQPTGIPFRVSVLFSPINGAIGDVLDSR